MDEDNSTPVEYSKEERRQMREERRRRKERIQVELAEVLKETRATELEEDFEPEVIEALEKAAAKLCYRKKYYDVMKDNFISFPSVSKTIMTYDLMEEAEKHYFDEDDEFPMEFSAGLRSYVTTKAMEREQNGEESDGADDEEYLNALATDIDVDSEGDDDPDLDSSQHVDAEKPTEQSAEELRSDTPPLSDGQDPADDGDLIKNSDDSDDGGNDDGEETEEEKKQKRAERRQRKRRIHAEFDQIIKETQKTEMDEDFEPEAIEALRKAAIKICFRKKYYNVFKDTFICFPSVFKTIMNYDLMEEAEKYYYDEDDDFPMIYSAALRSYVTTKEMEREMARDDDGTDDDEDEDYLNALATDVDIDSDGDDAFDDSDSEHEVAAEKDNEPADALNNTKYEELTSANSTDKTVPVSNAHIKDDMDAILEGSEVEANVLRPALSNISDDYDPGESLSNLLDDVLDDALADALGMDVGLVASLPGNSRLAENEPAESKKKQPPRGLAKGTKKASTPRTKNNINNKNKRQPRPAAKIQKPRTARSAPQVRKPAKPAPCPPPASRRTTNTRVPPRKSSSKPPVKVASTPIRKKPTRPSPALSTPSSSSPQKRIPINSMDKDGSISENFVSPRKAGTMYCSERFQPSLHSSRAGCELCIHNLSFAERDVFAIRGRHIRVVSTSGGCSRSCAIFPRMFDQTPIRLCRTCYFSAHDDKSQVRQVAMKSAAAAGKNRWQ